MRIAQVAPLFESVPPKLYGGTERVVSYLTEELVRQGHEVTLFASGDSETRAELIAPCRRALRLDRDCRDVLAYPVLLLERVAQEAHRFDILHFHCDYLHYPMSRRRRTRHVTTLHGRLDLPDLAPLYREFAEMPVVSISDAQRDPLPWLNWVGTVYHGLPPDLHTFRGRPGSYLAFLGRMSPEKQPDQAIAIARRSGLPLKMAAKVDDADREYFETRIAPLLRETGSRVEFVGEVGGRDKDEFLGGALALLFPIDWPEPFGLVMIEAMACGTPVIAYRRGSVPEVMQDGVSGFVVDNEAGAVEAVRKVRALDRWRCRQVFEERYSAARMTRDYVRIYQRLLADRPMRSNGHGRAPRPWFALPCDDGRKARRVSGLLGPLFSGGSDHRSSPTRR